jgi:hypothetical protein
VPDHDDDLAAELRGLATWLQVPEPADQRAAVRERLAASVRRRRRIQILIASVAAALAGTVASVAPARAAVVDVVGDLLRVAGIEVDREARSDLPARPSPLPSLRTTALDEARRTARFPVKVPTALGPPSGVLVADPDAAGAPRVVTLTYRGGSVRFDQFDGAADPGFFKSAPNAEWVDLGPDRMALWLPEPHAVTYVGRDGIERTETARLATPTLIWSYGPLTYRLEGLSTLAEAKAIARSVS